MAVSRWLVTGPDFTADWMLSIVIGECPVCIEYVPVWALSFGLDDRRPEGFKERRGMKVAGDPASPSEIEDADDRRLAKLRALKFHHCRNTANH